MDVKATTKQIFALRKEGKLEDAIQLARPLYAAYPADQWVVGALGWVLYDCIKRDQKAGLTDQVKRYVKELQQLGITAETNDILFKQTEFILKTLSPEYAELNAAKELSKDGQHAPAADILRKVIQQYPGSSEAKTSLGWELYRLLHIEADLMHSIELMRDYCRLKLNTKPDRLHSLFLSEACKRAETWEDFLKFIEWWKIDNLTPEDWQESFGTDGSGPYPSNAVKLAKALYKNAKKYKIRGASFQWMLPFVRKVVETTDSDWTPYYLAKLAVWFDADLTGVRDLIVPLVKCKQREFWAWQALAECTTDNSEKTAFYARAVLATSGNEDFKVDLYHQFAIFLSLTKQHEIASLVAGRYVSLQIKNGKSTAVDIVEMQKAPWFKSQIKDDLDVRLEEFADNATRLLFAKHPWTPANFIEVLESKDGRPPLLLLLIADKGYIRVKHRCNQGEKPERGAAIRAKLFWPPVSTKPPKPGEPPHGPPLGEFYEWESRRDGAPYDCAKSYCGVVSQVNTEKMFARVSLTAKSFGLLHFDTFPEATALIPGDVVIVAASDLQSHAEDYIPVLNFRKEPRHPVHGLYREFEGQLDIRNSNSFGFVTDRESIFVSPTIISNMGLSSGDRVKGWAIREWNKKKQQEGWSTLTIEVLQ